MMQLLINGQNRAFEALPAEPKISDLVAALGMAADRVAIEHNGEIVSRAVWAQTSFAPGDKFEIVHFVGGGAC